MAAHLCCYEEERESHPLSAPVKGKGRGTGNAQRGHPRTRWRRDDLTRAIGGQWWNDATYEEFRPLSSSERDKRLT